MCVAGRGAFVQQEADVPLPWGPPSEALPDPVCSAFVAVSVPGYARGKMGEIIFFMGPASGGKALV